MLAPFEGAQTVVEGRGRVGGWLKRFGIPLEVVIALGAGVGAASLIGPIEPLVLAALLLWVVTAFHAGRAAAGPLAGQLRQSARSALPALAVMTVAVGFFEASADAARQAVPAVATAVIAGVLVRSLRWRALGPLRIVVVGDRAGVSRMLEAVELSSRSSVVGAVLLDDPASAATQEGLETPGARDLSRVRGTVRSVEADLVLVAPGPSFGSHDLKRLHHSLEDLHVGLGVHGVFDAVAPHRIRAGWVASSTVLDVRTPQASGWVRGVKSVTDRALALVALLLVTPLLVPLMVAIRLESPGPALFRQVRIGRRGEPFTVFKLRTMVNDAETIKPELEALACEGEVLFKLPEDPRVTRLGAILRRYSLDELPQLLNVLRGEMSFVGPRPHLPEEVERMDADARRRLAVQPGITGLWQVSGRSDLSWTQAKSLDTYYADNWSLGGDLKILAQTLPAVFRGRGAY